MTHEEMGVDHGHVASVVEGVGEFVEDVLSQDVVIQLPGTPHVEGEASHLAFHFVVSGLVPIILGAPRGEIHDVVVPFQLVRHLPQVIPRRDVGLTGTVGVDDGVGVEVEDLFLQPVEVLVQLESGVTGGAGGDESSAFTFSSSSSTADSELADQLDLLLADSNPVEMPLRRSRRLASITAGIRR